MVSCLALFQTSAIGTRHPIGSAFLRLQMFCSVRFPGLQMFVVSAFWDYKYFVVSAFRDYKCFVVSAFWRLQMVCSVRFLGLQMFCSVRFFGTTNVVLHCSDNLQRNIDYGKDLIVAINKG